jgi:hypothetical protein
MGSYHHSKILAIDEDEFEKQRWKVFQQLQKELVPEQKCGWWQKLAMSPNVSLPPEIPEVSSSVKLASHPTIKLPF